MKYVHLPNMVVLLFLLLLAGASMVRAQVSLYTFSQSVGTYTPITGGTILGTTANNEQRFLDPANTAGSAADNTGPGFPIGFNFAYNGLMFDRIGIHTNGWISLGNSGLAPAVDMTSVSYLAPLSSSAIVTPDYLRSRVAAVGADLQGQSNSELKVQTIGTAPNRVCVVQWTNYRRASQTAMLLNFQIRLNEAGNTIAIVFGNMVFGSLTNTADVGLGGFTSADFNNRRTISPHNWNSTLAGTSNISKCTMSSTAVPPANGRTFLFTPPACQAPFSLPVSVFSATTATYNFTCTACTGTYIVEYGPPDFVPGTGATAGTGGTVIIATTSPVVIGGLLPLTYYDVYVRQNCGGTFSPNSGVQSFLTRPPGDDICSPLTLTTGLNTGFTNSYASVQSNEPLPPLVNCNVQNAWCPDDGGLQNSLWFTFTPPQSGLYSFDCYGFNTQAALWQATSCNALLSGSGSLLSANDNGSSTQPLGALLQNVCLLQGQTYFLQVDGYNGAEGSLSIEVTFAGQPPAPTIICPANIVQSAGFTGCNAYVNVPLPVVNSLCSNYTLSNNYTNLPDASALYAAGVTVVTYTVTSGTNTNTCSFSVTVTNSQPPAVTCQNIAVTLNASGTAAITPSAVFSAFDACFLPHTLVSVQPALFTCANVGSNTVTLTAADAQGNTATCSATVTVTDILPPVANCQNTTVLLNASGSATVAPAAMLATSSDNCGAVTPVSVVPSLFTCANVGSNTATLTVQDASGNTATCSAQVLVQDQTPPAVVCQPLTVALNSSNTAVIAPSGVFASGTDNCGTVTPISVTPNSFGCQQVGSNTVTLVAADAHGNTSSCSATVTVNYAVQPAPICQNIAVTLNNLGMALVFPADVFAGSTDNCGALSPVAVNPALFTCSQVGQNTVTLFAADGSGNTSSCSATITVSDTAPPVAQCQNASVQLNAQGQATITPAAINNNSTDNCGITQVNLSQTLFACNNIGNNTVTLTVADASGNSATCNAQLSVSDAISPVALCQNATAELPPSGIYELSATAINNGSSDNCQIESLTVFPALLTCANIGNNTVTLTATDNSGNTATCSATVNVIFNILPTELCKNATVALTPAGTAAILPADVFIGNTDDCAGISPVTVQPGTFACANVGSNTVTLTVVNGSGFTSSCNANVTVTDNLPPNALCQNISVNLPSGGNATITAAQINNGSTDNCGIGLLQVFPDSFTCTNTGINAVTLTVTDVNGNTGTCTAQVAVTDNLPPVAQCQNQTVYLNAAGTVTVAAAQVNNGSSDNCGISQLVVFPNSFTCTNAGGNTVVLTVSDAAGNSQTCNAAITVADNLPPVAQCQNATVTLTGGGTPLAASLVNNGSSDNCGIAQITVAPGLLTCANAGSNTVVLTVSDAAGNTATCSAAVQAVLPFSGSGFCSNTSVTLPASGTVSLPATAVFTGPVPDACGFVQAVSVSPNTFTCANVGINTITLTTANSIGNTGTCTAQVAVTDNLPPVAQCQNLSVNLDVSGQATITPGQVNNGSSDNCGISQLVVFPNSFTCANAGGNTVVLTVSDAAGNSQTCNATITVADNLPPVAQCQNATVTLTGGGTPLAASLVNNGSSDNCGIAQMTVAPGLLTCANAGSNTVVLTVSDAAGNTATCSAAVQAVLPFSGSGLCSNTSVTLPASGTVSLPATAVFTGPVPDACGFVQAVSVSPNTFTCANVGINTVTLTTANSIGNTGTCTAQVAVTDNLPPVAQCQNLSVYLDVSGQATITPEQVNNGSSDNCGINEMGVFPNAFTCANVGSNTVTLTAADAAGNTGTCTASVVVIFDFLPVDFCRNIVVELSNSGTVGILPSDVFIGNADECGGVSPVLVTPNAFTCADAGINTVTLTAVNAAGSTTTCNASVTVTDAQPPVMQCQSQTVQLGASGIANITAAQVNNNSTDNCGISQISVLPNSFTCANVGSNTVTLTASDVAGNTQTCQAAVTVADNLPPVALCQNTTVVLNEAGTALLTPEQINNGSYDNCGISQLTIAPNLLTCANAGSNTVLLTAVDVAGNTGTCSANLQLTLPFNGSGFCKNAEVSLPASGTVVLPVGAVFTGSVPDACGFITVVSVSPSVFTCAGIGVNTVTLTTANSIGNTGTCTAQVTVSDNLPPQLVCPSGIVSGNSPNTCGANLIIPLPAANDNCALLSVLNSKNNTGNASGFYNTGTTTVTFTATDVNGNSSSCAFTVTVNDTQPPAVICPNNITLNSTSCSQVVNWATPAATDNCVLASLVAGIEPGSVFDIGLTTVVYTAQDGNGNTGSCSFTVTIADTGAPSIVCPANIVQAAGDGTCSALISWALPQVSDACSGVAISNASHIPGANFNSGTTVVAYTASDSWGNTATCAFTVTITDLQPPQITCPTAVVASAAANSCQAALTIPLPSVWDNCQVSGLVNSYTGVSDASGSYNTGASTVTYTASDATGNTATCSFTVTITDTQPPQITCPQNVLQTVSGTTCFSVVIVPLPAVSDNCAIAGYTNNFTGATGASGAYLVGTTTVVYTANDTNGNTATCSFTVTVNDAIAPVIVSCPANIVKPAVAGTCNATATWNTPVASDNCSAITLVSSVPSGSTFNTGITVVTYTATDVSGNTTTCSFTVTITDSTPPVIACPANISSCSTTPIWPAPTASDACLLGNITSNYAPGGYLPPGVNTITYTATDVSGNTATCSFSVTINNPVTLVTSTSSFNGNGVTCFGASNGIANAIAIGGTLPFTYQWSNGATGAFVSGLPAGIYSVSVTDALGCSATGNVTLTQPPPIVCSVNTTASSCANLSNGTATAVITGTGTYNYNWSGPAGPYVNAGQLTGLSPGMYTVTVTNSLGCTCSASGMVNSPPITGQLAGTLTTVSGGVAPLLYNFSNIVFTGGTAPYTFNWNTSGYVQYSTTSGNINIIYTNSSYWAVTISDNDPCTEGELIFSSAPDVDFGVLTILTATVTGDSGGSNGSISLTVIGGNPCSGNPYHYNWLGPSNWFPAGNTNTPNLTGLPSGWYVVSITDCGPDGVYNTGDEQEAYGYYWIAKAIRGRGKDAPPDAGLLQAVPNPVNTDAQLWFMIPADDRVTITLFDITGREESVIYSELVQGGLMYQIPLNLGWALVPGVYVCQLRTEGGYCLQERIVWVK